MILIETKLDPYLCALSLRSVPLTNTGGPTV